MKRTSTQMLPTHLVRFEELPLEGSNNTLVYSARVIPNDKFEQPWTRAEVQIIMCILTAESLKDADIDYMPTKEQELLIIADARRRASEAS